MVLASLAIVTVAGLLLSIADWRPVSLELVAWLSLSALLLGSGYLSQIVAVRSGELSFISPFSYTGILVAVFYGYLIWDDLPDLLTIAGIALIVGAGMYILAVGRISRRGLR